MQPRSRIRGRDPPPPLGGRYRRQSPPPPSPCHQRRPRDPPSPQAKRRSSEQPPPPPPRRRRYEENPLPDGFTAATERRSRADILLEAGRLAAHYLVTKGLLPEHVLRAREDPNHNPSYRPEPPTPAPALAPAPAPSIYGRKRDEDDGPRWRRSGSGAGDLRRDSKGNDDREARRSGWDRKSHSFDERRKYNDGGGGDGDRGSRRTRDYNEPKRPPMSRSYSHNDRRASADGRVDRRRRSRSRSRSSTRSYHSGNRRDADWRAGARDLDRTKVLDSGVTIAGGSDDGDTHDANVDEMLRRPMVPSSVVVLEMSDNAAEAAAVEDKQVELEIAGLNHAQDMSEDEDGEFAEEISEDEDGEFAASDLNDEDGDEMDGTQSQLSNVHVHLSESIEEPVHRQSQLSNPEEGMETGIAHMDACLVEPLAENNVCSQTRYEMEAPQNEAETTVGDLFRDELEQRLATNNGSSEVNYEMEAPQSEFETGVAKLNRDEQEHLLAENNSYSEVRHDMETPQSEVETGIGGLNRDDQEQPLVVTDGYSEVRYETEAPQTEVETVVDDLSRDEQELPTWYKIFDLNVIETPVGCEISCDPQADDICDYVPDFVGQVNQQANDDTLETQCQDDPAGANQMLEDEPDLNNCDLNNKADEHAHNDTSETQVQDAAADDNHLLEDGHDLTKYNVNAEAGERAHDNHLVHNSKILLNHTMVADISDNYHMNSEKMLLKQDVDEQQMENKQMLTDQDTKVQVLDSYHLNNEHLLLGHGTDDHHAMAFPLGVHDLDNYYLSGKQILNNDADQHAGDMYHLKEGQIILDEAADGQDIVHNMGNGRTIPVIDLEEDYAHQCATRNTGEYLESKSDTSDKYTDNALQEHMCSQD